MEIPKRVGKNINTKIVCIPEWTVVHFRYEIIARSLSRRPSSFPATLDSLAPPAQYLKYLCKPFWFIFQAFIVAFAILSHPQTQLTTSTALYLLGKELRSSGAAANLLPLLVPDGAQY